MKSIQFRLIALLGGTMALLSLLAGGGVYTYLRHALVAEFDRSLDLRCRTLCSLITVKPNAEYDVDIHTIVESEHFRISDASGKTVAQSSDVAVTLTRPSEMNVMIDTADGHGTPLRAVAAQFEPLREDDDEHVAAWAGAPTLTLVVARDRSQLDRQLLRVAASIAATMATLSLAAVIATVWIIRRGLRILTTLATEATEIDVTQPDARFATNNLPAELLPIAQRLNDMLDRVGETITRERRFSADVAHELRTPIAELRAAAEVALRSPKNAALGQLAVTQARDIAVQMQTVVGVLLSIVRKDSGIEPLSLAPVALNELTTTALTHFQSAAGRISPDINPTIAIMAEPILLIAVLDNLIGNALHYAAGNAAIFIRAEAGADHVWLTIDNAHDTLMPNDIEHLFEPFWRKDPARSDGTHVGLGLTLARSYCRAMKADIAASMPEPTTLRMTLTFRRAVHGSFTPLESPERRAAT